MSKCEKGLKRKVQLDRLQVDHILHFFVNISFYKAQNPGNEYKVAMCQKKRVQSC